MKKGFKILVSSMLVLSTILAGCGHTDNSENLYDSGNTPEITATINEPKSKFPITVRHALGTVEIFDFTFVFPIHFINCFCSY